MHDKNALFKGNIFSNDRQGFHANELVQDGVGHPWLHAL